MPCFDRFPAILAAARLPLSAISSISPRAIPERFNSSAASSSARSGRLPDTGITSGRNAGNIFLMVLVSLVNGETTNASPA